MSDVGSSDDEEAQALAAESAPGAEPDAGPEADSASSEAEGTASPDEAGATADGEGAATDGSEAEGFRGRVTRQGEETIGRLTQDLLEHPLITATLSAMFETRERATRAQEVAMSALNLPSASDIERLTRRLRSVSQRLEGLEDGIDQVAERLERFGSLHELYARLEAIEAALGRIEASLGTGGSQGSPSPPGH